MSNIGMRDAECCIVSQMVRRCSFWELCTCPVVSSNDLIHVVIRSNVDMVISWCDNRHEDLCCVVSYDIHEQRWSLRVFEISCFKAQCLWWQNVVVVFSGLVEVSEESVWTGSREDMWQVKGILSDWRMEGMYWPKFFFNRHGTPRQEPPSSSDVPPQKDWSMTLSDDEFKNEIRNMMCNDPIIHASRKFRNRFFFRNRALQLFWESRIGGVPRSILIRRHGIPPQTVWFYYRFGRTF